jgi:GntR family transcriptional regulator, transcriptional repressor for pyruvate dehydrogenase complex
MAGMPPARERRRVKPQRTAEVVASALRDVILRGELTVLPRIEDLTEQFQVGAPALREAMRILETEGLITVRRGNVGGADVHLPTPETVAYMVSLVLQSKATEVRDVGLALRQLEPLCAALCAARPDRHETVVPELRALLEEQTDALGDRSRFGESIHRFHRTIVTGCGNESLVVVVGALEVVWSGHTHTVYGRDEHGEADIALWKAGLRDHERIVDAIAGGDANAASKAAAKHLEATQTYISDMDHREVTGSATAAVTR